MNLYLFYIIVISVFSIERIVVINNEIKKEQDPISKKELQYWYFIIFYIWITLGTIGYYMINSN